MGGGGKGGSTSQTSTVQLSPEIEAAALQNLDIANEVAGMGYVPYRGNTVAGLTPMQRGAMDSSMGARAAFGMDMPEGWRRDGTARRQGRNDGIDPYTGMRARPTEAGGVFGYSPVGVYEDAQSRIPEAQRSFIDSFFIDPHTGERPTNPVVPSPQYDPFNTNPEPVPEAEPDAPADGENPYEYGTPEYHRWFMDQGGMFRDR